MHSNVFTYFLIKSNISFLGLFVNLVNFWNELVVFFASHFIDGLMKSWFFRSSHVLAVLEILEANIGKSCDTFTEAFDFLQSVHFLRHSTHLINKLFLGHLLFPKLHLFVFYFLIEFLLDFIEFSLQLKMLVFDVVHLLFQSDLLNFAWLKFNLYSFSLRIYLVNLMIQTEDKLFSLIEFSVFLGKFFVLLSNFGAV